MNKKSLSERDICTKVITPALEQAGWDIATQIREEFPLTIAEFGLEKKWWGGATRKGRKASQHAWKVSAVDVAASYYNLDCKNPHEVTVNHRDPAELMREYQEIVRQLTIAQNDLKSELMQALGGKT